KVTAELPSTVEGVLVEIVVPEGETVDVGTIVCVIDESDGASSAAAASGTGAGASKASPAGAAAAYASQRVDAGDADTSMRGRHSPAVRRLADEHQIDLSQLTGSGLGGRITRSDVLRYMEHGAPAQAAPPAPAAQQASPQRAVEPARV